MSRIQDKFKELKSKNEKALISYIMAGFPNENTTLSIVRGFVNGGTDIIELGFPFSDPIADGPVIQNASTVSLNKGAKIEKFFGLVKKIRKETDIPLVLMTYTNVLYTHGYTKFMSRVKSAGIDGLILPDMSIEESKEYLKSAKKNGLDTEWYENGNKWYELIFKDGEKNGLDTEWYLNGAKRIEEHYKNGVKDGRWTRWSKDGEKIYEKHFKGGNEK